MITSEDSEPKLAFLNLEIIYQVGKFHSNQLLDSHSNAVYGHRYEQLWFCDNCCSMLKNLKYNMNKVNTFKNYLIIYIFKNHD